MLTGRLAYACLLTSRQNIVFFSTRSSQVAVNRPRHFLSSLQLQARHIMSATSDEDVRSTLRQLLPNVDMDTTSERKIREVLAEQLGTAMDPYKKLIKDEIDRWLTEAAEGAAGAAGSGCDDAIMAPSSLDPVGKRKRAAAESGERAAKVARSSGSGGAPQGAIQLDNKGLKWVSVSAFKGQQRVDLRNFFRDRGSGELGPTKKGVSMSQADWSALQGVIPAVSKALQEQDDGFVTELPGNRRATVSVFSGKLQVGVREYYEENGELKPSMKGINLLPDEWQAFCQAVPNINKQLVNPPPAAAAAAAPAAAGARPAAAAGPSRPGAGKAAAAGGGGSAAGDDVEVQLGGKKRAAISTFTGSACVDLRECYEKDGKVMPGKKGIMLKPDQWRTLVAAADEVTAALTAHNTRYSLELGNKRRVTISDFKNVWYVGVREFYEQDGVLKPGSKGLSMNREQWQKLVAGMDSLTAQLT